MLYDHEEDPPIEEETLDTGDAEEEIPSTDQGEDETVSGEAEARALTKVAMDWIELEGALENNSPELHSFLNTVTGDVIRIVQTGDDSEVRLREAEASDEFVYIEPIPSREQYRWMEEFIETVEEATLKDKLNIAIDGKGAFRRFKDVLMAYPAERERWFTKRSAKLRTRMTDWATGKGLEPTNAPPWECEDGEGAVDAESRPRTEPDQRARREGSVDLRELAHEMIDLVPSRELPTAVAFLEFLRSRRGFRRNRYS